MSTVLSTALTVLELGAMAVIGCFFLRILEEIKAETCSHSHLVIRNCVWLKQKPLNIKGNLGLRLAACSIAGWRTCVFTGYEASC